MTITEPDPVIAGPLQGVSNDVARVLISIGIPLNPPPAPHSPPGQPVAQSWGVALNEYKYAWPGYPWPNSFNAEIVASLTADVLGRLAGENAYQAYVIGQDTQLLTWLFNATVDNTNYFSLTRQISRLQAGLGGSVPLNQLPASIQGLPAQLQQVYDHFTAIVNLLGQGITNLNNHFTSIVNQLGQGITNANNAAAAGLAYEASIRTQVDDQLGAGISQEAARASAAEAGILAQSRQDLTAETARAQATENTIAQQVANETARATGAETFITGTTIPGALLSLRTQLQPQIDKLATETDSCLKPLCDTVTPNASQLGTLGKLLKALESDAWLGLLVAAIADAVADPIGAAHQTDDTLGALTQRYAGDFKALVGSVI